MPHKKILLVSIFLMVLFTGSSDFSIGVVSGAVMPEGGYCCLSGAERGTCTYAAGYQGAGGPTTDTCNRFAGYYPYSTPSYTCTCTCQRLCPVAPFPCFFDDGDAVTQENGVCGTGYFCNELLYCEEGVGPECSVIGECNPADNGEVCNGYFYSAVTSIELLGDNVDNDCDGIIDETDGAVPYCEAPPLKMPVCNPDPLNYNSFTFLPNTIEAGCGFADAEYLPNEPGIYFTTDSGRLASPVLDDLLAGTKSAVMGECTSICRGYDYGCNFAKMTGPANYDVYSVCWNEEDYTPGDSCSTSYSCTQSGIANGYCPSTPLSDTVGAHGVCVDSITSAAHDNDGDGFKAPTTEGDGNIGAYIFDKAEIFLNWLCLSYLCKRGVYL